MTENRTVSPVQGTEVTAADQAPVPPQNALQSSPEAEDFDTSDSEKVNNVLRARYGTADLSSAPPLPPIPAAQRSPFDIRIPGEVERWNATIIAGYQLAQDNEIGVMRHFLLTIYGTADLRNFSGLQENAAAVRRLPVRDAMAAKIVMKRIVRLIQELINEAHGGNVNMTKIRIEGEGDGSEGAETEEGGSALGNGEGRADEGDKGDENSGVEGGSDDGGEGEHREGGENGFGKT